MTGYLVRNLAFKAEELLKYYPVVVVTGARQCGKTSFCKAIRPQWAYFDMEREADYNQITGNFDLFFREYSNNLIIDEAQASSQLFQELRGVVDKNRTEKNRFLLTGSSSFDLLKNISESLAGRAAIIELGTFKNNEILSQPVPLFYSVFNADLCSDNIDFFKSLEQDISYSESNPWFFRGGYPEPALSNSEFFHQTWMDNYIKTYINRDVRKLFPGINDIKYRRFVQMLASLSGRQINRSELARAIDVSEPTIKNYLDIAHGSMVWRNIPAWIKDNRKSLQKSPKGIFRDSGLAHYLAGIDSREKLFAWPQVGFAFEAWVTEELIKGLDVSVWKKWNCSYMRTRNGAEIDLILEGSFGLLPIEIKIGTSARKQSLTSLRKFVDDHNLPYGLLINNSERVCLADEKIVQIPVALI